MALPMGIEGCVSQTLQESRFTWRTDRTSESGATSKMFSPRYCVSHTLMTCIVVCAKYENKLDTAFHTRSWPALSYVLSMRTSCSGVANSPPYSQSPIQSIQLASGQSTVNKALRLWIQSQRLLRRRNFHALSFVRSSRKERDDWKDYAGDKPYHILRSSFVIGIHFRRQALSHLT
jgi:hypothetical protein